MWKASIDVKAAAPAEVDDWDTDPDYVNDVTEQEQRWGPGGRNVEAIDMAKLREEVFEADKHAKQKQMDEGPKSSYGYGGKFGVQQDRMDKSAVGHDYVGKTEKHVSQKDYAQGFGGKFGVQTDRMDASAVGHDYVSSVEKHVSQTDHSHGFGGKFGVQTDRVDKSAAGWEHKETIEKHSSQKDYSAGFGGKFGVQTDSQDAAALGWDQLQHTAPHNSQKDYAIGFGGKFGVQTDRQDASAVGWDHQEKTPAHASQVDHKKGFGGKFGIETDRVDKSAHRFDEVDKVGTNYTKQKPDIGTAKPSSLRAKFENMAKEKEQESVIHKKKPSPPQQATGRVVPPAAPAPAPAASQERAAPAPELAGAGAAARPSALRNKFENMARDKEQEALQSVQKIRQERQQIDKDLSQKEKEKGENEPEDLSPEPIIEEKKTVKINPIPVQQEVKREEIVAAMGANETVSAETNLPDVTRVNAPKEEHKEKDEITRQPTIVVSPVGWDAEGTDSGEGEGCEEEEGYTARALYDYQAAAPDEISFDPDDVITNIVMIDEGWWQGLCKGSYGLFPANYVQLQDK